MTQDTTRPATLQELADQLTAFRNDLTLAALTADEDGHPDMARAYRETAARTERLAALAGRVLDAARKQSAALKDIIG